MSLYLPKLYVIIHGTEVEVLKEVHGIKKNRG